MVLILRARREILFWANSIRIWKFHYHILFTLFIRLKTQKEKKKKKKKLTILFFLLLRWYFCFEDPFELALVNHFISMVTILFFNTIFSSCLYVYIKQTKNVDRGTSEFQIKKKNVDPIFGFFLLFKKKNTSEVKFYRVLKCWIKKHKNVCKSPLKINKSI